MNINQANAEKFLPSNPPQPEQRQQQRDPIQELNPISLLKKPDQFKESFFSMACISGQSFKAKNYQRAALALNKCVDMLDLGRNILKQINRFWKLVVYANLACCYHYTRKLSKCNKFCQKIKDELDKILSQNPEKEVFLKLSRILIKLKFQHCAILSQLEMHQKAFELCKSTLPMLKQVIQTLLAYVQSNSTLQNIEKKSSETVQFSRHVHRFAQNLLTDLLKSLNEPLKSKQKTVFYYWQKNPEQNQEQVKKKFIPHADNNNCKRSILGVSKSTHWIDEFNIGTIMHFSEMNINDFDSNVPIEEYLFKDRLYELVIYCSMANFTMATQLRLIESTQQEKAEGAASSPYVNLMKKYGYEQKSQLFKMSEVYHLRSIDIMARNIKITVPYLTHIIRSYQKHYIKQKKVLEAIAAIVEESALSLNQSINDKAQKQEEDGQQYYETTYKNYLKTNHYNQDKNEYNDAEPIGDLLLESQNYQPQPQQIKIRIPQPESEEKMEKLQTKVLTTQVKGSISPLPANKEPEKKLISVKSDNNILRVNIESPKEEHNTSGEYLKSHKNKSSTKMKKNLNREKSSSKLGTMRSSNLQNGCQTQRTSKHEIKQKGEKKVQAQKHNDYKLKGEKPDSKKQKQRKTIKKQKLLDFDNDKYGQKQIKIKTQSCTHIKVFYKKNK